MTEAMCFCTVGASHENLPQVTESGIEACVSCSCIERVKRKFLDAQFDVKHLFLQFQRN
jgi:hypothetical protein